MKITKRDLGVLMILAGILIAFLVYQMSFTSTMEDVAKLQEEQNKLRSQIKELQPLKDNSAFYIAEMERFEKEINDIVEEFPINIIYEDGIMYVVGMEEELDVKVPSLTVNPAQVIKSVSGNGKTYSLKRASESIVYTAADYDTLKELLKFIYAEGKNKNTITAVSMAFDDETGEVSGSVNISLFVMDDGSRIYVPADIPEEEFDEDNIGIDVIFGETEESDDEETGRAR